MTFEHTRQIALLLLEASIVSFVLLAFFRLRHRFGLALLCVTLGSFQHLQTELAAVLFVEVAPGIVVSPGSTVLFMATLFAVLLVYIRDDAIQARSVIVGIAAANVTLTLVMLLVSQHLGSSQVAIATGLSMDFLTTHLGPLMIGTAMLFIDVVLIIVLYEFFFRLSPKSLFVRIAMSMVSVAVVDTFAFVGASFYGQAGLGQTILSGLIGKMSIGVFYSALMAAYLRLVRPGIATKSVGTNRYHDIFHILTYRQRFELLKDELSRDSMTGLFNRRFFDENLILEVERAGRLGHCVALMLLDLDNFKQINDQYGHQVGDRVIRIAADGMQEVFRAADVPCRYGGEEFAIIMPDSSQKGARDAASRLNDYLSLHCKSEELPVPAQSVTFTAGISFYPDDAMDATDLLKIADRRLYAGKHGGRNQVVLRDPQVETSSVAIA